MSLTNMIRKAEQIKLNNNADVSAQRAENAALRAAQLEKQNAKFADACAEKEKFIRIIRTQLGRLEFPFLTYSAIQFRAVEEADIDACELLQEFIDQERADIGEALELTDDQILALWSEGVALGRLESMNPKLVANYYFTGKGIGANKDKPYVRIAHFGRVIRAAQILELTEVEAWAKHATEWYTRTFFNKNEDDATKPVVEVVNEYDCDFIDELNRD